MLKLSGHEIFMNKIAM